MVNGIYTESEIHRRGCEQASPPPRAGGSDSPLELSVEGGLSRDLFARYAGADLPLIVLGVVTSVLGRVASPAPPLVLGVAVDATFNDSVAYTLPFVPAESLRRRGPQTRGYPSVPSPPRSRPRLC